MSGPRSEDPPASLGAVGCAVWRTIVKAGPYQDSDALVLERYCQLHDRRRSSWPWWTPRATSCPAPSSSRQPTRPPRLAHDIEAQMTLLESVLALNPEARARLELATA